MLAKFFGPLLMAVLLVLIIASCFARDAKLATPTQQPVVGYAYTATCVTAGKPAQVHFVLKNQSSAVRTVVVWHFGIGVAEESSQKGGPFIDADTARSGLIPTPLDYLWRWDLKLKPGQTVEKILYIRKVPPSFLPPASEWDPSWGPRPLDRTVFGAIANVRFSTVVFDMNVWPVYC